MTISPNPNSRFQSWGSRPLLALSVALLCSLDLPGQCETSRGNAHLGLSGLTYLGSDLTLGLEGPLLSYYVLAMALPQTVKLPPPWGTLCIGTDPFILARGGILSKNGVLLPLQIPKDRTLKGLTLNFQGVVDDKKTLTISNAATLRIEKKDLPVETIFFEDFEVKPYKWFVGAGTGAAWEIGTPTVALKAHGGSRCLGTILGGKYASAGLSTRMEGPRIQLPTLGANEQIRVNFRVWFDTELGNDYCSLQVSEDLRAWKAIPDPVLRSVTGQSWAWTQFSADLSSFAGKSIYLGFYFSSRDTYPYTRNGYGVYVDNVHVFKGVPAMDSPEGFEEGLGFWWYSDEGLWQAGKPTVGPKLPGSRNTSNSCVATYLHGTYPPSGANTSLISPPFYLPPAPAVRALYFKTWFGTEAGNDYGSISVTADGGKTWATLPNAASYSGNGRLWSRVRVSLVDDPQNKIAIQGKTIRIRFTFKSRDTYPYTRSGEGWYLDDIEVK